MQHDYSLARPTVLEMSPVRQIQTAQRCGYRYVGLRLNRTTPDEPLFPLTTDKQLLADTKACLADSDIGILDVEVARMDPQTEPETYQSVLETAALLGAPNVITQFPDPDRQRVVDRFGRLCEMAKPLGLHLALEFMPWLPIPDLSAVAEILRAVNHPNGGVLVDTLHFHRSSSSIEELKKIPREWFKFVHIADAPPEMSTTTEGFVQTARRERLFPGEGVVDFDAILGAMPENLPYALEIPHEARWAEWGIEEFALRAIRASQARLDS